MVERTVLKAVQNYIEVVRQAGIHVDRAVLFGSHVRREALSDSDIDILVIAPEFDGTYDKKWIDLLWELRAKSDSRIEPIPVGKRQWQEDDASAIIEIARREGQEIPLPFAA
jgi:predicted nucleotidyltransferase